MSFHPNQIVTISHFQYPWKLAIVTGVVSKPFIGETLYIIEPLVGPKEIQSIWKNHAVPESCLQAIEIDAAWR